MVKTERPNGSSEQRDNGRQQVIGVIRHAGKIARIDIAQETGVSPATVTAITSDLIQANLIEEVAPTASKGDTRRGRPRVALKIRGAAHLIAGIKISNKSITITLVDFEGTTLSEHEAPMPKPKVSSAELVRLVCDTLKTATGEIGRTVQDLSGVGLGVAGIIDAPRGFVHWSPSLTDRNVELRAQLEDLIDLPFFIDNDANLVAKAEQLFGKGRNVSDFIVVTIEHGVGMGIVISDQVYRGTRGCGAEFGHTKVQLDGALCRCGQRGCLEAYVADYALLREADISSLAQERISSEEQLNALFEDAKAGNQTAQSIFHRAGRMFAMGLANIVNIFDPKLIILSGERMQFDYLYADEVLNSIKNSVVQVDVPPPEILIHKWGDLMWAKGAAAYAIEGVTENAVRQIASNA